MGIGARLEAIMAEKNVNTSELANMVGVPPTTLYSMIRRDSSRVDIDLILKLAHALGMTADELLTGETINQPQTLAAHLDGEDLTPEEMQEIDNFIKYVKSKRE